MAAGLSVLPLAKRPRGSEQPAALLTPAEEIRRLDWRFLLPSPQLGRVMFLGPAQSTLLSALRGHATRTGNAAPVHFAKWASDPCERFDTCVLQYVDEVDIENAARLLMPGGWLYWEITRPSRLAAPWRALDRARGSERTASSSLAAQRDVLMRAGLHAIAASWHYPTFESSRWIIPLDGGSGIGYFLRNGPPVLRRIRERLGAGVVSLALLPEVSSSVSFVAQKPMAAAEDAS